MARRNARTTTRGGSSCVRAQASAMQGTGAARHGTDGVGRPPKTPEAASTNTVRGKETSMKKDVRLQYYIGGDGILLLPVFSPTSRRSVKIYVTVVAVTLDVATSPAVTSFDTRFRPSAHAWYVVKVQKKQNASVCAQFTMTCLVKRTLHMNTHRRFTGHVAAAQTHVDSQLDDVIITSRSLPNRRMKPEPSAGG